MATPPPAGITPPPTPPQRSDAPNVFSSRADAFIAWFVPFFAWLTALIPWFGTVVDEAAQAAADAESHRDDAAAQAALATNQAQQATDEADRASGQADAAAISASSAESFAAAAGSAAGLPALVGNANNVLKVRADESGVEFGPGMGSGYQEFASSGQWEKPERATWVYIEVLGAGASGEARAATSPGASNYTVNGGAGGAVVSRLFRAIDLPDSVSVVVGAGGAAQTASVTQHVAGSSFSDTRPSTPGGISRFGTVLSAEGGGAAAGGHGGDSVVAIVRGANPGGRNGISSIYSGASGGGVTNAGTGTAGASSVNGVAGTPVEAGFSGTSPSPSSAVAPATASPGCGGGAAYAVRGVASSGQVTTAKGGNGGNGRVRIWWW